jgi:hypothetical protein
MTIMVQFAVEVPFGVTDPQLIDEWIGFECGDHGDMSLDNPLCGMSSEPILGTFNWEKM